VDVTVSAKTVASQVTTLTVGVNDLTHTDGDFWVGKYVVNNSQSVGVTTTFDSGMVGLGEVIIAENICGSLHTPYSRQTETGAFAAIIRSSETNSTFYFVVNGRGFSSYTLNISVENVVCKKISSSVCPEVNYPTYPNDASSESCYESQLEYYKTNTSEYSPKECVTAALRLQCYLTYPKCDENNFPVYPCLDYCNLLWPDCDDSGWGDDISCYAYPTTNCFSSGVFLQIPLLVIISFIGMLFLV